MSQRAAVLLQENVINEQQGNFVFTSGDNSNAEYKDAVNSNEQKVRTYERSGDTKVVPWDRHVHKARLLPSLHSYYVSKDGVVTITKLQEEKKATEIKVPSTIVTHL